MPSFSIISDPKWYPSRNYEIHSTQTTSPKGICSKVNVIARLEFELAYDDSAVHHFNNYVGIILYVNANKAEYICFRPKEGNFPLSC